MFLDKTHLRKMFGNLFSVSVDLDIPVQIRSQNPAQSLQQHAREGAVTGGMAFYAVAPSLYIQ